MKAYRVARSDEGDGFRLCCDEVGAAFEGWDEAVLRVGLEGDGLDAEHSQRHPSTMSAFNNPT